VWSWRPLAGVKLATMLCIAPMTVTKKSWTPGRARRKPLKPLRGESRAEPVNLWWTYSYAFSFCMRGCGCIRASGFPCALCFQGTTCLQDSGSSRRGNTGARQYVDAAILRDARLRGLLRMRSEQVASCPHGEEARSAVSNHEAAEESA
jgi:hypothetical protein